MPNKKITVPQWWDEVDYSNLGTAAKAVVLELSVFTSSYEDEVEMAKMDMYQAVLPYISGKWNAVVIHNVPRLGDVWVVY